MKTLTDFRRRLTVGTRLFCVHNQVRPVMTGTYRTVTKVQGNGYFYMLDGETRRSWADFPKAADVTAVDGDEIEWRMTADKTLRLRVVEAANDTDRGAGSFQSYIGGTPSCPICRGPADCRHFIGYAEGGKLVERMPGRSPIVTAEDGGPLPTDVCVNTGVSTRVYRDYVFGG